MVRLNCPKTSKEKERKKEKSMSCPFPLYPTSINRWSSWAISNTFKISYTTKAKKVMETHNLTVKQLYGCLLLSIFAIISFQASFSEAETHYHEFVVCVVFITIFVLLCVCVRMKHRINFFLFFVWI